MSDPKVITAISNMIGISYGHYNAAVESMNNTYQASETKEFDETWGSYFNFSFAGKPKDKKLYHVTSTEYYDNGKKVATAREENIYRQDTYPVDLDRKLCIIKDHITGREYRYGSMFGRSIYDKKHHFQVYDSNNNGVVDDEDILAMEGCSDPLTIRDILDGKY